jgi:uncharacterized protein (TIGR03435 family)
VRKPWIPAVALCCMFSGGVAIQAQPANPTAKPLHWDVISVKPMAPGGCAGGGVSHLPDGLSASCVPVAFVVEEAFHLMDQTRIAGLPEWAVDNSHPYAIEARVPGEDAAAFRKLSREEKFGMFEQVLTDRFGMKTHRETRVLPAYDLLAAKGGPKLKEASAEEPMQWAFGAPTGDVKWVNAPVGSMVWFLGRETGRPVIDKTGLTGKYDFTLEFEPAARADKEDRGRPSVFTALEEQLGLKLVSAKEPVEVLVIDSIQQPAAN